MIINFTEQGNRSVRKPMKINGKEKEEKYQIKKGNIRRNAEASTSLKKKKKQSLC